MDRLYRFTIPGIAFIVALGYFIFSLSGYNILTEAKNNLLTLVTGVLSTPIIGLMVTSILHLIIHLCPWKGRPGPYWLYLPEKLSSKLFDKLADGSRPTNFKEWRQFYWKYQHIFRSKHANEKVIDFTAHRWTYYFVLVNTAFALFLAILVSFILVGLWFQFSLAFGHLVQGLIISILFIVLALMLSRFSLKDAREVEYLDVMDKIKKD